MVQGKRCKWGFPCKWARRGVAGTPRGSGRLHWPGVNGQQVAGSTVSASPQKTCTHVGPDRRGLDAVTPPEFPLRRCPQVGFSLITQRTTAFAVNPASDQS